MYYDVWGKMLILFTKKIISANSLRKTDEKKKFKSIQEVRVQIDKIDEDILNLIFKRQDLVIEAVKHKTKEQIIDEVRIEYIISKLRKKSELKSISPELIEKIWRLMINNFIEFEKENFDKIHKKLD